MKRVPILVLAGFVGSSYSVFAAPAAVTAQRTTGAQNMSNSLRKLQTQHVPLLEQSLRDRNLPKSVVNTPSKILKMTEHELKAPLELGLTGEPQAVQGATTTLEVRGNGNSSTLKRVQVTSTAGNIQGAFPTQHIQMTSDNSPQPQAPAPPRPYRDPRAGIQLTDQNVVQWHVRGASANPNVATGAAKMRTIRPVSPGLMFRGQPLPAGSHLVTVQSGANATVTFNGNPAPLAFAGNGIVTRTYLLKANATGGFNPVKLTAQEATDLQASQPQRSYTIKNGAVQDNIAPGYDPEALRSGGFLQ